mgnify:CR=1
PARWKSKETSKRLFKMFNGVVIHTVFESHQFIQILKVSKISFIISHLRINLKILTYYNTFFAHLENKPKM